MCLQYTSVCYSNNGYNPLPDIYRTRFITDGQEAVYVTLLNVRPCFIQRQFAVAEVSGDGSHNEIRINMCTFRWIFDTRSCGKCILNHFKSCLNILIFSPYSTNSLIIKCLTMYLKRLYSNCYITRYTTSHWLAAVCMC